MVEDGPKGRRGKWSLAGVPHKGWTCIETEDFGEPSTICGMCESMEIRYGHYMTHADYRRTLICGEICAGHMEGDLKASKDRDKTMRDSARMRKNFPKLSGWKTNHKGNHILSKNYATVTVFRSGAVWRAIVSHPNAGKEFSENDAATPEEAKLLAFDIFQGILKRAAAARKRQTYGFDPEYDF
jgi:hypothetical protein